MTAVVAYVASLNGIANPNIGGGGDGAAAASPTVAPLTGEAARGRELFSDAVKSFGRCSTCHEVQRVGIPVAAPIGNVPADVAALKALATPGVRTATLNGESMPSLVLSQGKTRTLFYDLTSAPPVLHSVDPSGVQVGEGSGWRHSSVTTAYNDSELSAVLTYLRVVVR